MKHVTRLAKKKVILNQHMGRRRIDPPYTTVASFFWNSDSFSGGISGTRFEKHSNAPEGLAKKHRWADSRRLR